MIKEDKIYTKHTRQILAIGLVILSSLFLLSPTLFAQVPQGINYQAVARDTQGVILKDTKLEIRISIPGTTFSEEHKNIETNAYGLFTLVIGFEEPAKFQDINWGGNIDEIKIEVREQGGSIYQELPSAKLQSVPYALYAEKSKNAEDHANIDKDTDNTNELIDTIKFNPITNQLEIIENTTNIKTLDLNLLISILNASVEQSINQNPLTDSVRTHLQNDSDLVVGNEGVYYFDISGDTITLKDKHFGQKNIILPPSNNTDNQLLDISGNILSIGGTNGGNWVPLPLTNASNGLTKDSITNTIKLGGDLSSTTTLNFLSNNNLLFKLGAANSAFEVVNSASSSYFKILQNGKIGIKQTNPTFDLDVNGSGQYTGNLTVGDTASDLLHAKAKVKLEGFANINSNTVNIADRLLIWRGQSHLIDTIAYPFNSANQTYIPGSGLSLSGTTFHLGGTLSQDAIITHSGKKVEFKLGASSATSFFEINKQFPVGSTSGVVSIFKAESNGSIQLGNINTASAATHINNQVKLYSFSSLNGLDTTDRFIILRSDQTVDTLSLKRLISLLPTTSVTTAQCPSNMSRVKSSFGNTNLPFNDFCIDRARVPVNYEIDSSNDWDYYKLGNNICREEGKRLCTVDELSYVLEKAVYESISYSIKSIVTEDPVPFIISSTNPMSSHLIMTSQFTPSIGLSLIQAVEDNTNIYGPVIKSSSQTQGGYTQLRCCFTIDNNQ